jgi:hypothetical protein
MSGGLPHAAGLDDGHQHVQVLQLDPPTDALAQLHAAPLYENTYIMIKE